MEAIGRLAGGIAHDFNNLMMGITGYAKLVIVDLDKDNPLREDLEEIKNAGDAMPQGGKLTIETSNVELDEEFSSQNIQVRPGPHILLAVKDTGVGMDKETLDHIFEPFFTTKAPGEGTGLGLSTVFGTVIQSGGHIFAESDSGKGTTFKIYLPRVNEDVASDSSLIPAESTRGTETILLVEDEDIVRKLAKRVLSANGYTVLKVRNPGEALLVCSQHKEPIHLLITDVVLPQMSGRKLADRLTRLCPALKVLYISGYTENDIVHRGILDEGTQFLQKPMSPETLLSKLRNVLDLPHQNDQ